MKKVSVAMCTYNGALFLQEQLDSFLIQSTLPNEVVICDDGSTDETIAIIQSFMVTAPFLLRLYTNDSSSPLGSTKNFERAITLCKGEIIVLCDQDDVWYANKLTLLKEAIEDGAGLVFSNADLVDESLTSLNETLFASLDLSAIELALLEKNNVFEILLKRNIVTGAATAFSSKYLPLILPISVNWVHDGWLGLLISSMSNVKVLHEPLLQYRQHSKNQIGAKKLSLRQKITKVKKMGNLHYSQLLNGFIDYRSKLISFDSGLKQSPIIDLIDKKIVHLSKRAKLANRSSFPIVSLSHELFTGEYHKFSSGYVTYCRDMVMMMLNKL